MPEEHVLEAPHVFEFLLAFPSSSKKDLPFKADELRPWAEAEPDWPKYVEAATTMVHKYCLPENAQLRGKEPPIPASVVCLDPASAASTSSAAPPPTPSTNALEDYGKEIVRLDADTQLPSSSDALATMAAQTLHSQKGVSLLGRKRFCSPPPEGDLDAAETLVSEAQLALTALGVETSTWSSALVDLERRVRQCA